MKVLTSKQLYIQLQAISPLSSAIQHSVILDCWRVGHHPAVDLIGDDQYRHYEGIPHELSEWIHEILSDSQDGKLILVCDLFAEHNSPAIGIEWSIEMRTKGAILGAMSCLMVLLRNENLKELLTAQPERFAIVTVHDIAATLYSESSSALKGMQSHTESPQSSWP
ncbi:MAG: hypothetical protein AAB400_03985 [Patescibacteria group bacterium]